MRRAPVTIAFRLVLAALTLTALVAQFRVTLVNAYSVVDFFSYFTNLSNLLAVVVFVVGAVRVARGVPDSRAWSVVRAATVVAMVFVGVVFNVLLAGLDVGAVVPWVNVVVHMVMPVAVLLDWVVWPPERRLPWRAAAACLVFPVAYTAYSLVRGAVTGFYPYPFYDPAAVGGVGGVALYLLVLVVALAVLSTLVVLVGRRRRP
jgi:hypothetical protein